LTTLALRVRTLLLSVPEATRIGPIRRATCLFSQGQSADAVYFIEDGLIKLTRTSETGSRIISSIHGPGQLLGEDVLAEQTRINYTAAETLTPATVYRVPREALRRMVYVNPDVASAFVTYILERSRELEEKAELLCLYDVEYRILHYLSNLAKLVKPIQDGLGHQLPLTQLELADLVGATRETTSTTLNLLERRGLIVLSRRLMTVHSPATLMDAARNQLTLRNGAG